MRHWQTREGEEREHYADSDARMSVGASLGRLLGSIRPGIHHERLLPGRRKSYPHAERAEEAFIFVPGGYPDAWINGELHSLSPGDVVAFPAGTGICHTFIHNSEHEARF